jgi:hypothetical protein
VALPNVQHKRETPRHGYDRVTGPILKRGLRPTNGSDPITRCLWPCRHGLMGQLRKATPGTNPSQRQSNIPQNKGNGIPYVRGALHYPLRSPGLRRQDRSVRIDGRAIESWYPSGAAKLIERSVKRSRRTSTASAQGHLTWRPRLTMPMKGWVEQSQELQAAWWTCQRNWPSNRFR